MIGQPKFWYGGMLQQAAAGRFLGYGGMRQPGVGDFTYMYRFTANGYNVDTQSTGPAYIRMRLPLARGPLDPLLSQPYSISSRAGPLHA